MNKMFGRACSSAADATPRIAASAAEVANGTEIGVGFPAKRIRAAAGRGLETVAGFNVGHFVSDDGREQPLLVGDTLVQTARDVNIRARQGKGVDLAGVEQAHAPLFDGH